MTSSVVGPRTNSMHFPRPNLYHKRSWSLFGGLLLAWSTAFWIWTKPLHLRSMLSNLMRCIENCNACIWHWSTERGQNFSMTRPNWMSYNQYCKRLTNSVIKFCLIDHIFLTSRQLTTISSSISTTFCRQNASATSKRQEMLLKSLTNWSTDFYATRINKLIFHCQKCVDCNGSYFD